MPRPDRKSAGPATAVLATACLTAALVVACARSDDPLSSTPSPVPLDAADDHATLIDDLDPIQAELAEAGRDRFAERWSDEGAADPDLAGLGPTLNATSCADCHTRGAAAAPPATPTDPQRGLILRLHSPDDPDALNETYGAQIQDRAVGAITPEATITPMPNAIDIADHTVAAPRYTLDNLAYGPLPNGTVVSPRLAPPIAGIGLLEAVPITRLESLADPDDTNQDGISGTLGPGRFGWQATQPTAETQITEALHQDLGVTTTRHPDQNCPIVQIACTAHPVTRNPELDDARLEQLLAYVRYLAPPSSAERDADPGSQLFESTGCAACHTPTHTTRDDTTAPLANRRIRPHTDLLLHDMGDGLADRTTDGTIIPTQWRTPPLWGLRLRGQNNRTAAYLHDGRATTITEAILWHAGEAEPTTRRFLHLTDDDRTELLDYLETL